MLLSDGRATEPRPAAPPEHAAVFTVAVAAEDPAPAVWVTRVQAPPRVRAGERVPVRVRLAGRRAEGRVVRVVLGDGTTSLSREATLGPDETGVDFVWPAVTLPGLPVAVVNPRQVRDFARALGRPVEEIFFLDS